MTGADIPAQRGEHKPIAYTPAQASAISNVPVKTLQKLARTGELPCKRIGRRIYIPVAVLEKFMNADSP